jgi:hypothetical protein
MVIGADADFQGGSASILDRGAAILLNQRQHAQDAAPEFSMRFLLWNVKYIIAQDSFMLNLMASFADNAESAIMQSHSAEMALWPAYE